MVTVRRIRREERERALDTVVAAFRDDPQVRWYFPDDAVYAESARRFFGVLIDLRVDGGEVWVADDCDAVAMWNPPGGNLIGPELASGRYSDAVAGLPEPGRARVCAVDHAVDPLLPSETHWYLGVLACRPERQGHGLGAAVIAPVLASADRAGLPVALETGSSSNVNWYLRRGFGVAGRTTVQAGTADDRVEVWVMRREPSAG